MITIRASETNPGIRPDQLLAYFRSEREAAREQPLNNTEPEWPSTLPFPYAKQTQEESNTNSK